MGTCRSCKWWDIDYARKPSGRIYKDGVAPCMYPVEEIKIPESCRRPSLSTSYMCPGYGEDCPCHETREEAEK